MSTYSAEHLYELLPAVYRLRDAENGYPLKALLAVIAREIGLVEEDIARLYANWFIETADEWVVPYIGDLLGVRGLHALELPGFTRRAFVANTLGYRRRKGTPTMLEQLARDTTLWNARVVEFFELLGTTQYLNHLRPHNVRTPDLRRTNELELLDTPFDTSAHTADVRRIAAGRGKHNIPNVGIFLWRLQAYYLTRVTPHAVADPPDGRYTFSSLGNDMPLFNRPRTEATITHLATEVNVPGRLRRRALYDDLERYRHALISGQGSPTSDYFDPEQPVLEIYFDQPCVADDPTADCVPLRPEEIAICDLSGWDRPGWQPPASETFTRKHDGSTFATKVAVDPVLGRLAVLQGVASPGKIEVSYAYGFSGDLGGGPYDQRFAAPADGPLSSAYENTVADPEGLGRLYRVSARPGDFATLQAALNRWALDGKPAAVIEIADSRTYTESLTIAMGDSDLVVQAANRQRPTLIGDLQVTGNRQARLALNGLLIAGTVTVGDDSLRQLDVVHCTLVPGVGLAADGTPLEPETPSVIVGEGDTSLTLNLTRSISGPLRLPRQMVGLRVSDSIIESPRRDHPAALTPALVSAELSAFPAGFPASPRVRVTIGGEGPHVAALASAPTNLTQARDRLRSAIRNAHPTTAFARAEVIAVDNRLVVLPGEPAEVRIEPLAGDPTAALLGLASDQAERRLALVSGDLEPFPTLTAATPTLRAVLGDETHDIELSPRPGTLVQARNRLSSALRAASTAPAFAQALVGTLSNPDRLVIIPGAADVVPAFDVTSGDPTTLAELRLAGPLYLPAIGGDHSGARPGPSTTLERVTVLGPVHAKELSLASEVVFTGPVRVVRRQAGCVRFSYVPPAAQTPRRFRCQPELAIAAARERAGPLAPADAEALARQIRGRLRPAFTSTRYGDPAYGQLGLTCPEEIWTGAEDGAEMGAFSFLQQPQRLANLRSNLDEYLRFGLEAGIFFVT